MANKVKKREDIAKNYKWDLSKMVESDKQFDEIFEELSSSIKNISKFSGKLGEEKELLACLKLNSKLIEKLVRLYAFSMMTLDENAKKGESMKRMERASNLYSRYGVLSSYITPELSELSEEYLKKVKAEKAFADFDIFIDDIIRSKKHTLSKGEEELLAKGSEVFGMFSDIFNMTNNADISFGEIEDEKGEMVELTHSLYGLFLSSEDREVRKRAYDKCYETYKKLIHTISTTYIGSVKKDVFMARARNFESALEKAMFYENVDKKVYEKLLENVDGALPLLHRYVSLRKKAMKLDDIHFYDLYVSLVANDDMRLDYEKAYELVKEALTPLGDDYQKLLERARTEGWIDVYNNDGKRSGAYSNSIYGVTPYVLLNYEKTAHDIFTIAHELGHAMHSYFSNEAQVFEKADYTIFVAEVASTVNEVLLLRHIIDNTDDENVKKFCLNYFLEMLRTTLFRQTMFAEFEYIAHDLIEKDVPVTYETLSEEYEKLNKKYYGKEMVYDDNIKYEWARIPHFYRAFYVYKYSTGIISAISIAYEILEKGEKTKDYLEFLKSGGTDAPTELLKIAGVDLLSDAPYKKAMEVFEKTLAELETLL